MADFKTKLMMLAGAATLFSSMAFGQTCALPLSAACVNGTSGFSANAVFIRAEGTTELVAPSTVMVVQPSGAAAATLNLSVYLTPAVNITSQIVSKVNEATATPTGGTAVPGTVSSNSVTFNGIVIPANPGPNPATTTVTIAFIRVNASTIATTTGVPTGVSETVFVGGTGVTPSVPSPVVVGYAVNGLGAVAATNTTANTICAGAAITAVNFNVTVADGFAGAFKTKADEAINGTAGASAAPATSGTRLTVTFANVPNNVSLYVPLSVKSAAGAGPAVIMNITSPTAAFAASTDAAVKNEPYGLAAVTLANNTGTTYYEVTTDNLGAVNTYTIPVYLVNAAGTLTAPTTSAITATVSFAPIGSSTNYPNFVNGTSTATVNGSTFVACSTTLLFPYVTNVLGFETGIAIANTSLDALGSKGASAAATQSGTCTLSFYGNNGTTTTPANPASFTTGNIAGGGVGVPFTLTSAAGSNFTGYMIATCNFQYAHGFAYIISGFGTSSGTAEGYLALPFNGFGSAARVLPASGVEVLGN